MIYSDCSVRYPLYSAGLAHLVERHLAKVEVASSSLVTRSRRNPQELFVGVVFEDFFAEIFLRQLEIHDI